MTSAIEATAPLGIVLARAEASEAEPWRSWLGVALDRRAWCRVEIGFADVRLELRDRPLSVTGESLSQLESGAFAGMARVLRAGGLERGVHAAWQTRALPGADRCADVAVAVAAAAAALATRGGTASVAEIVGAAGVALTETDARDATWISANGGLVATGATAEEVVRLAADPGRFEEGLLLVDASAGQAEAEPAESPRWSAPAFAEVRERLVAGRWSELAAALQRHWVADPGPIPAGVAEVIAAVYEEGGAATAGGLGRWVLIWAPPGARDVGPRERIMARLAARGLKPAPLRLDLRGLEVERLPPSGV